MKETGERDREQGGEKVSVRERESGSEGERQKQSDKAKEIASE